MRHNIEVLWLTFAESANSFAKWLGVSHGTIGKWYRGESKPLIEVAEQLGVSYDWLLGRSQEMWADEVHDLRRRIRPYLASLDAASPTARFIATTRWLIAQAPHLCTPKYVAALTRMTPDTITTGPVGLPAVRRLARYIDVPEEWFLDGNVRHLSDDPYDAVIAEAKAAGITPDDLKRFIEMTKPMLNR